MALWHIKTRFVSFDVATEAIVCSETKDGALGLFPGSDVDSLVTMDDVIECKEINPCGDPSVLMYYFDNG